ncbi:MAG TPA: helix-hairpin-helix domain-containing protein [Acidimicrobiia bacterium]|nr:helix-hairpin-helix domain-containing protein [Acidimicrobiia bacterium]
MTELLTIPYIGKAMVRDFDRLGIHSVEDLVGQSHQELYDRLCVLTKSKHDPCVLDTFEMAVHFAQTGESLPWWTFSRRRKEIDRARA